MAYAYTSNIQRPTKSLDKPIATQISKQSVMELGSNNVIIQAVDVSNIPSDGILIITYADENQSLHNERYRILGDDGMPSSRMRKLFGALGIMDTRIYELLQATPTYIGLLTGMGLTITIAQQKGYVIEVSAAGDFVVRDAQTRELKKSEFVTRQTAFEWLKNQGLSYAKRYVAEHAPWRKYATDTNQRVFDTAIESIVKATTADHIRRG